MVILTFVSIFFKGAIAEAARMPVYDLYKISILTRDVQNSLSTACTFSKI